MKRLKLLVLCLLFAIAAQDNFGQSEQRQNPNSIREDQQRALDAASRQREDSNNNNGYTDNGFIANRPMPPARRSLYKGRNKEISNLKKAFERTKNLLAIPESYYEKYKASLKDKGTHLARLQPDKDCYGNYVVSVEDLDKCSGIVPVSGGGSMYSFNLKLNYPLIKKYRFIEDGILFISDTPQLSFEKAVDWWNIHFINDKFVVQNTSVRGIISQIGDVNLENITLTSKELGFLNNFKLKNTLAEIRQQNKALEEGISFNDFVYSSSVPVQLNATYVLRSIDYRSLKRPTFRNYRRKADKRADLTIAFKVVGRESDGSIVILWKELSVKRVI